MERERLLAVLGTPELRWIWERIHERLLQGRDYRRPLRYASPSTAEREAVARLTGRMPRGDGLTLDADELERTLVAAGLAKNLPEVACAVLGADAAKIRLERLAASTEWDQALSSARKRSEAASEHVAAVIEEAIGTGILRRLSEGSAVAATRLTDALLRLAERLPAREVPLAQLAAEVAGDAHALDEGMPLGTLASRLVARLGGVDSAEEAEERRTAWARMGVLCDELSAPALVLNLRPSGDSPLAEVLRIHGANGEPARLSVRQLVRSTHELSIKELRVFVCENPSIVAAAADNLGNACAPLVCTEGMPRSSVHLILERLRASGAELAFHADFDWAGVRIGNLLLHRYEATPWRMSAHDYEQTPGGPSLYGLRVPATWDAKLEEVMSTRGTAAHEEAVVANLLADLEAAAGKGI